MNTLRIEHYGEARPIEAESGARSAHQFLARSLAWEHRLRALRAAADGGPIVGRLAPSAAA